MNRGPIDFGGVASWSGCRFEIRCAVDYSVCVLLAGESGLARSALASCRMQPANPGADFRLDFEDGSRWLVQAKSGAFAASPRGNSPLVQALENAVAAVESSFLSPDIGSNDRFELLLSNNVPKSISILDDLCVRVRSGVSSFGEIAAACSKRERDFVERLVLHFGKERRAALLRTLALVHVRRTPDPLEWERSLRSQVLQAHLVQTPAVAANLLAFLTSHVVDLFPLRGVVHRPGILRASMTAGIEIRASANSSGIVVLPEPDAESVAAAMSASFSAKSAFLPEPSLREQLSGNAHVIVYGRPGSGKSRALLHLALVSTPKEVVVITKSVLQDDLPELTQRRARDPFVLLWDNIGLDLQLFARVVLQLVKKNESFRLIASCSADDAIELRTKLGEAFWAQIRGVEFIRLGEPNEEHCLELATALLVEHDIAHDAHGLKALVHWWLQTDPTPLQLLSALAYLSERHGSRLLEGHVSTLPTSATEIWYRLYDRLEAHPDLQSVLRALTLIARAHGPRTVSNLRWTMTAAIGCRDPGDTRRHLSSLEARGWVRCRGDRVEIHDVCLSSVVTDLVELQGLARAALKEPPRDPGLCFEVLAGLCHSFLDLARSSRSREAAESWLAISIAVGHQASSRFGEDAAPQSMMCLLNVWALAQERLAEQALVDESVWGGFVNLSFVQPSTPDERRTWLLQGAQRACEDALKKYENESAALRGMLMMTLSWVLLRKADLIEDRTESFVTRRTAIDRAADACLLLKAGTDRVSYGYSLVAYSNAIGEYLAAFIPRGFPAPMLGDALDAADLAVRIGSSTGYLPLEAHALAALGNRVSDLAPTIPDEDQRTKVLHEAFDFTEKACGLFERLRDLRSLVISLTNLARQAHHLWPSNRSSPRFLEVADNAATRAITIGKDLGTLNLVITAEIVLLRVLGSLRKATDSGEASSALKTRQDDLAKDLLDLSQRTGDRRVKLVPTDRPEDTNYPTSA